MIDSRHTQQASGGRPTRRVGSVSALALGAVVVAALASPAGAAARRPTPKPPKPLCNLVSDAIGDVAVAAPGVTPDLSLDVISADVATNKTTLTWVIRVAKLGTYPDAASPAGRGWQLSFSLGAKSTALGVADGLLGPQEVVPFGGKITLDRVRNEVRYSVPLSALSVGPQIQGGAIALTNLKVATSQGLELPAVPGPPYVAYQTSDSADGAKAYPPGRSSCLVVGS